MEKMASAGERHLLAKYSFPLNGHQKSPLKLYTSRDRLRIAIMVSSVAVLITFWSLLGSSYHTTIASAIPSSSAGKDTSVNSGSKLSPNTSAGDTAGTSGFGPDADGKYTIRSSTLELQFIPYGASLTNLFVKPTKLQSTGEVLDIVAGWDNASYYAVDPLHPHFGGVVGRYANRIKNGTFEIDGREVKVDKNEHGGLNQLHGGSNGWDYRNWSVVSVGKGNAGEGESITFGLADPDGEMGFEGEVLSYVTYTVIDNYWDIYMTALATTKVTPIMLSSHVYWNLDGFRNPQTPTVLNHTLHLPYSGQRVATDTILIPTGEILPNEKGGVHDFWSQPRELGFSLEGGKAKELNGSCGGGCVGYDNCYIHSLRSSASEAAWLADPVAIISSQFSGIELSVFSDQDAFQVYDCVGMNGTAPLKKTQGFNETDARERVIEKNGCVVLEVQDWIDGINHPEWGRESKQVFGPGRGNGAFELRARYVFDV